MTGHPLLVSTDPRGIARVTLNRPDRLNALTGALMRDLRDALSDLAADEAVRAIVLTGAGRAFCAGQDLTERDPRTLAGPLDLAAIQRDLFHPVVRTLRETDKPTLAVVNGTAAGAGAAIALAADIVVASRDARFVFSFAKVGLSVDAGLGQTLARALGAPRARALLMLGAALTGAEAAAQGLIWQAVPDADLDAAAETLADALAAAPRVALSGIKQAVAAAHLPPDDYLETEARLQGRAGAHPDYAEGVLAFLERRPARFL